MAKSGRALTRPTKFIKKIESGPGAASSESDSEQPSVSMGTFELISDPRASNHIVVTQLQGHQIEDMEDKQPNHIVVTQLQGGHKLEDIEDKQLDNMSEDELGEMHSNGELVHLATEEQLVQMGQVTGVTLSPGGVTLSPGQVNQVTLSSGNGEEITIRRVDDDDDHAMETDGHGDNDDTDDPRSMSLEEQIALLQSGTEIQIETDERITCDQEDGYSEHNNDISDHVISIEEDGQITIETFRKDVEVLVDKAQSDPRTLHSDSKPPVPSPPKFPQWWQRLSSIFHTYLHSAYLVDVWLVCMNGEAVPAHQLLLAQASPLLASWLRDARIESQEEAVTVSLPDVDSVIAAMFVTAVYKGELPQDQNDLDKIERLAFELGVNVGRKVTPLSLDSVSLSQATVCQSLTITKVSAPKPEPTESEIRLPQVPETDMNEDSSSVYCGDQQVQVVQTESGEILLVTCDPNQGDGGQGMDLTNAMGHTIGVTKDGVVKESVDDEVEKIKEQKIAQIKEQQARQCPVCYNTAIAHRFNIENGGDQKFAYRCCHSECNLNSIKTARAFNQHMIRHGELTKEYEPVSKVCPLCFRPRIEHKNRGLADLEKGNHKGNLYKCCHCAASKLTAKKFFLHMENHVAKKYVCETCHRGYSYLHLLNEHVWKEHGEGQNIRYNCTWEGCDYSAKYKQTLHTHVMERHHGVKRRHRQDDAYTKICCPTCNKTLKKWYYHQFHKKTCASGNVIYQCEICGKEGFINSITLQNHVRSRHSQDRPFTCEYCPAKYATAMSLSGHRSRKHGVNSRGEVVPKKMFPCGHCGKLLTSKMKLQCHIEVIHEGKREFKCTFCEKTFTSKSNLQIHEGALHTGVLPYKCDFCNKMFARKSQLATHKENQHPGHAGPFFVVEDVDSVQVEDIIIPVQTVEDGHEVGLSVGVDGIVEGVSISEGMCHEGVSIEV